ncbi:bifunctional hydroxymethylpyrimidine kinase/phosphomethylpyrimidine kinase [Labilibaculum filiforme]|uniref:hydroxymethylpyrimidine kinase n=1 Tax=Labilibaculum filiforme TaxID=1940526 RepID=A0A2N3HVK0_9BACT|nr:bifunctional hydroxymethylpyrimidine kinase/phosphomethylpyrimidine kinase [Labilibaculum filiforme]PKQ62106.1 bifunctional hydroxymethylpyrimidine kinase/phosphomethylpyrimidine kinase [Labilibaculum filiforme]
MKQYKRVLAIAGSDSGGGAGIQADIKAISACECFATTAITAITAQNTLGVTDIHAIPVNTLKNQIKAVLEDIGTDSIKIGMLHNSETILTVSKLLKQFVVSNIVLDPVMVSTSGSKLLRDEAIHTLQTELIPQARVITPNIPEAEILLGKQMVNQADLPECARKLGEMYKVSVLLKAGHLHDNNLIDVFFNRETNEIIELASKRITTQNTHGTGCTLSSALAAFLARGFELNEAVKQAKDYINNAIIAGKDYSIGAGHGPVKHFYELWKQ